MKRKAILLGMAVITFACFTNLFMENVQATDVTVTYTVESEEIAPIPKVPKEPEKKTEPHVTPTGQGQSPVGDKDLTPGGPTSGLKDQEQTSNSQVESTKEKTDVKKEPSGKLTAVIATILPKTGEKNSSLLFFGGLTLLMVSGLWLVLKKKKYPMS